MTNRLHSSDKKEALQVEDVTSECQVVTLYPMGHYSPFIARDRVYLTFGTFVGVPLTYLCLEI